MSAVASCRLRSGSSSITRRRKTGAPHCWRRRRFAQAESATAAVTVPLHKKGGKVEEGWQGRAPRRGGGWWQAAEGAFERLTPRRGGRPMKSSISPHAGHECVRKSRYLCFAQRAPDVVTLWSTSRAVAS